MRFYQAKDINSLPQLAKVSSSDRLEMQAVATVLPFRGNNYVVEELIDWNDIPNDPIFRLTFPHPEMLSPPDLRQIVGLLEENAPKNVLREAANQIRQGLNPHPAGQKQYNVPTLNSEPVAGIQHKYEKNSFDFPHCMAGLPCLLHFLLSLASICGNRRFKICHPRIGSFSRISARASGSRRCLADRGRSDDNESMAARSVYRTFNRTRIRPYPNYSHWDKIDFLLALSLHY